MTWIAFLLVSGSALLHASWNFLSKSTRPSAAFFLLSSSTATLLWAPFVLLVPVDFSALPLKFYIILLASGAAELLYIFGLFRAYQRTDISMAYPLARALPVLLTAAVTAIFHLGKSPSVIALAGMVVVSLGCLLLPLPSLKDFRLKTYMNPALFSIIMAACGTVGYTVIDSLGMPLMKAANEGNKAFSGCLYIFFIELQLAIGLGVAVLNSRQERHNLRFLLHKIHYPIFAGLFASVAYMMILVAMTHVTNVSFIQAFRQVSLPLGVCAGIFILKESCSRPKLIGIILVLIGLILTAFK